MKSLKEEIEKNPPPSSVIFVVYIHNLTDNILNNIDLHADLIKAGLYEIF